MKIAQIAPLADSCPPRSHGGTERMISYLTEELVRQGHEVTLFASGDSETSANLVRCSDRALHLNRLVSDPIPYYLIMLDQVRRRANCFDVLHFHIDLLHFPIIRDIAERTVTTLYGRLNLPELQPFYCEFSEIPLVSVSADQRGALPDANWVGTVHHGLPRELYRGKVDTEAYLAFLGRMSPERHPDWAIEIAARAGMPLKIAGKVRHNDRAYWEEVIQPLITGHSQVEFIGEINEHQKAEFLAKSKALLFPVAWPEPSGFGIIEAIACGTPVIAFNSGPAPELIEHGVSGFIVEDCTQAADAVMRIDQLDRREVRAAFERRFTVDRMARDYVSIYRGLAGVRTEAAHLRRLRGQRSGLLRVVN